MANRFPLIANSSSNQIQELANADNLDLTGNNIVGLKNIIATGVATAAQFSGNITGVAATFSGNVSVGGVLTYEDVTNIDSVGIVTARTGIKVLAGGINAVGVVTATTFDGSGANLTSIPAAQLTGTIDDARLGTVSSSKLSGALPAISGALLTGVISGVGIQSGGAYIGSGATTINFIGTGLTATVPSAGVSTITIASGGGGGGSISTEAATPSNAFATLDLSAAQDHKLSVTGIVTVTCTGGSEGDSHTVRIINSASATVGFSTYFLFPSGSTPSLPSGTGAISLISFTVNRVGTAGTQLLAGASVNFS